jgi:hypothetical protein
MTKAKMTYRQKPIASRASAIAVGSFMMLPVVTMQEAYAAYAPLVGTT